MFAENTNLFLGDFGQPCVAAGGVSFIGMLDQPDEITKLQRGIAVHSREYDLTYATRDVTLTRGQALTVNGQAYTVREAPRQIDDGLFSTVTLTKD